MSTITDVNIQTIIALNTQVVNLQADVAINNIRHEIEVQKLEEQLLMAQIDLKQLQLGKDYYVYALDCDIFHPDTGEVLVQKHTIVATYTKCTEYFAD